MSIYKSYKHGSTVEDLTKKWGVRKTFRSLKRAFGKSSVRIKHNKIQMINRKGNWVYPV